MKVCGIVCEYNPLHKGHLYHIKKARELSNCDILIACMSGNFVQRGEFAIVDKWTRTKAAINNGIDLVVELPFVFACQSAENFGKNAIDILAMAGCDSICFGSETNNLTELKEIAAMNYKIDHFKENMKKGYSYPYCYGLMADSYGPNDILAISYLRQLANYPGIEPISIKRNGNYHDEQLTGEYASAKAIRQAIIANEDVSQHCLIENIEQYPRVNWDNNYGIVRNLLLNGKSQQLQQIFLMDEGIENHLAKTAYYNYDYESFISQAITRRYTRSRIQRTLCHLLVNNTKADMANLPPYDTIRVLGFNQTGKSYLKDLQRQGVKVANHYSANIKQYRDIEFKAAIAYSSQLNPKDKEYLTRSEISGLNLQ
ncbi:MAG: nucleotidyltransferase family protein [Erysipelotrichaceae bacterium]